MAYPVVPVTSKVFQRLSEHVGSTKPSEIIKHFDIDEAKEDEHKTKLSANKEPDVAPVDADFNLRDYVKSKASGNEPGIDLSGVEKVIKDIPKDRAALMKKGEDPEAILSREEMDALDKMGGDKKYANLPFDGVAKTPTAKIAKKLQSISVKEGDKKPVTVAKEEATVVPPMHPKGSSLKGIPMHQMSLMDSGEAKGSGSGLFNVGNYEVGLEDLAGVGGLLKGLGKKIIGRGTAAAAEEGAKSLAKGAMEEGTRPMGKLIGAGEKEGGGLANKVFEGDILSREPLPAKMSTVQKGPRTFDAETVTDRLSGRFNKLLEAGKKELPEAPKQLTEAAKEIPRFGSKSREELMTALKKTSSEYGKAARSGDKETLKTLRFKLKKLQDMLGE